MEWKSIKENLDAAIVHAIRVKMFKKSCDWCSEKIEGMVFMVKSKHSKFGYHRLCLKCYKERK